MKNFFKRFIGFIILCIVMHFLAKMVHAESYKELSQEYNRVYAELLRVKIGKLPKHAPIEIALKNGTTVSGIFEGFHKYDDSIWINPFGSRFGFLSDDAYNVRELQDVKVIVQHRV